MSSTLARARFGGAVLAAFLSGLLFASAADLTRFGWAQQGTAAKPSVQEVKPLADVGSAFEAIAEHVTPAVVSIQIERSARARSRLPRRPGLEDLFRQFEVPENRDPVPEGSSGSGFIVSKDGYILTNNHVVADAEQVTVSLLDKRSFKARVIGRDPTTDVALIKIDGTNLPAVTLGNDEASRVGQWVLAIGNPLGLEFTVTAGIISAKGRNSQSLGNLLGSQYAITDFIQTDAAINPGNSGGPLVNIRSEVIGINSAIASSTGYYAGYGFAIPITLAKQVMQDLIAHGRIRRAALGVGIRDVNAEQAQAAGLKEIRGVVVQSFTDESSPAKAAGIELGDVIVAVSGRPVDRVSTLQRVVRGHKPGETLTVEVMRFGEKKTARVKLMEAPSEEETVAARGDSAGGSTRAEPTGRTYEKLGITLGPIPAELAAQARLPAQYRDGLLVTDVMAPGPAFRKILERRDIVVAVLSPGPRREVKAAVDLERAIASIKPGDTVTLLLYTMAPNGRGFTKVETLRIGG